MAVPKGLDVAVSTQKIVGAAFTLVLLLLLLSAHKIQYNFEHFNFCY